MPPPDARGAPRDVPIGPHKERPAVTDLADRDPVGDNIVVLAAPKEEEGQFGAELGTDPLSSFGPGALPDAA